MHAHSLLEHFITCHRHTCHSLFLGNGMSLFRIVFFAIHSLLNWKIDRQRFYDRQKCNQTRKLSYSPKPTKHGLLMLAEERLMHYRGCVMYDVSIIYARHLEQQLRIILWQIESCDFIKPVTTCDPSLLARLLLPDFKQIYWLIDFIPLSYSPSQLTTVRFDHGSRSRGMWDCQNVLP